MKFEEANKILNDKGYYVKSSMIEDDHECFFYYDPKDRLVYLEALIGGNYKTPADVPRTALVDSDNGWLQWKL